MVTTNPPTGAPGRASAATGQRASGSRRLGDAVGTALQRYALLVALALLVVLFSVLRPEAFFSITTLTSTLGIQAPLALLAVGVSVVLLTGEFDLSAASVMGMSASLVAYLTTIADQPVVLAVLAAVASAALIGAVNAFFVVKVGVSSFIVTLGMGTVVTGAAIGLAGTTTIGGVPAALTDLFRSRMLGVEAAFWVMLVVAALGWVLLQKMPVGRSLFFTGEAPTAARLAGIRVDALRSGSLVASSTVAAVSGVMLVGQIGAASPTISAPFLLPAFAAVFLGATAFTPGRFNVWGTVCAVHLLAVATVGFQVLGLSNWVTDVFNGAVLVVAVAFAKIFGRRG